MAEKVMIVAGEASGDLHGARLVSAMKAKRPDLVFSGMGGRELAAVGVHLLFDAKKIAVVGIAEVLTHLSDILAARKILRSHLRESRPDLLILIDFPDFNFMLAKSAKKLGIPVFYYISPQVWAWRPGRVKTMKKLVDRIGVILPFEEKFFRDRGVDAKYVGHPLLDSVKQNCSPDEFRTSRKIPAGNKCVGLLPGSRKREISSLLPILLAAAEQIQIKSREPVSFCIPLASTVSKEDLITAGIGEYEKRLDIHLITENRYDMMAACDAAVVVSGTVTLELALLDTPMVVVYKISKSTYRIGIWFISKELKYFSLVNLIADAPIVSELFQEEVNPQRIEEELSAILHAGGKREAMEQGLRLVRKKMGKKGASIKAAELALGLLC